MLGRSKIAMPQSIKPSFCLFLFRLQAEPTICHRFTGYEDPTTSKRSCFIHLIESSKADANIVVLSERCHFSSVFVQPNCPVFVDESEINLVSEKRADV